MKYLLLFIFLLTALLINAQQIANDSIYLITEKIKCPKEKAVFYRIISKSENGFLFTDFYIDSNKPHMIAVSSKIDTLIKNGHCIYFSTTGKKSQEGEYVNNKMAGKWTLWEEYGTDSSIVECFENGTSKNSYLSKSRVTLNDKYNVSYEIDEPAYFPGKERGFERWLSGQIEKKGFPADEKEAGISGTCYISFFIEKNGKIIDIDLTKGVPNGLGYDLLAIQIVMEMPNWKPATQFGVPIRAQFELPIRFVLK